MAIYLPPTENLPIFDPNVFIQETGTLTQQQADTRYLRFPVAQGDETIPNLTVSSNAQVNGNLVVNNNAEVRGVLTYGSLFPPVNTQQLTYTTSGQMVQNPPLRFTVSSGSGTFQSTEKVYNPNVSFRPISMRGTGNNAQFGFYKGGSAGLYGCLWYQPAPTRLYVVSNGINGAYIPFNADDDVDITLEISNGNLYVSVDGVQQNSLTIPIPSDSYYIYGSANAGTGDTQTFNNVTVWGDDNITLTQVLSNGNDAGNQNIVGVNQLTCSQLNYTTLNPPISGGGENLFQTLTIGNSAGNLNITNVNNISMTSLTIPQNQLYSNNQQLTLTKDAQATNGTIYDSYYNSPIPKAIKIINQQSFSRTNIPQGSVGNGTIFTLLLDTYYTNKINYAQIFFTNVVLSSGTTSTSLDMFLTDDPTSTFDPNSSTYTYQSIDLTSSNNNSFINNTGISLVFSSSTYFNVIYLCINSTFALPTFTANISGEISVGINIPTITANPT